MLDSVMETGCYSQVEQGTLCLDQCHGWPLGKASYRLLTSQLSVFKAGCVTAVIKMRTTDRNLEHAVCVIL